MCAACSKSIICENSISVLKYIQICIWDCNGKYIEGIYLGNNLGNKHFPTAKNLGKVNHGMTTQ